MDGVIRDADGIIVLRINKVLMSIARQRHIPLSEVPASHTWLVKLHDDVELLEITLDYVVDECVDGVIRYADGVIRDADGVIRYVDGVIV